MSIKDKIKQRQTLEKTKIGTLQAKVVATDETESVEYLTNFAKLKKLFYPEIDYSDAKNFSRYGNPKEVYARAVSKIYEMYPYDGSLSEKAAWEVENSYLERHIFENEYPRKVGYVTIGSNSVVVPNDASKNRDFYLCPQSTAVEYIEFKGGPHSVGNGVAKNDAEIIRSLKAIKDKVRDSNKLRYDSTTQQFDNMHLSNLYCSGTLGNTVEFWFNRKDRQSAQDKRHVIFDMHNFKTMSSSDYGRFRIEYSQDSSINSGKPLFYVTYLAPNVNSSPSRVTSGVLDCVLGNDHNYNTSDFFDDWHHVAISVVNSGPDLHVSLYIDGKLADKKVALGQSSQVLPVPHEGLIGAMASQHELDKAPIVISTSVSGSDLDVDISFEAAHGASNYENLVTSAGTRDNSEGLLNDGRTAVRQVQDSTALCISMRRVLTYPHGHGNMEISPEYKGYQQTLDMTVPNFAPAGTVFYGIMVYIKNSVGQTIRSYLVASGDEYRETQEDSVVCEKGHAKLPGSIDDFRFWKTRRSGRQIATWFQQQVGGNSAQTEENKTLGVYYKFNEGIHGLEAYDRVIIDYSGKKNNATWYGKPASLGRTEKSAIELYNNLKKEFKDPVLYDTHPEVVELQAQKERIAESVVDTRSSQLWRHLPNYVIESNNLLDHERNSDLRNLLSIMGSYLDELWLQIKSIGDVKNNKYETYDKTPAPFLKTMLEHSGLASGDIFVNSTVHELLHGQNSEVSFERDLTEVKNLIYQNIYSNLSYIYKSKGTMEGFYSLMRCFGIDEQVVKINLYANNTEYEFEDDYKMASLQRPYIDFYDEVNKSAVIYQGVNSSSAEMSPPGYSLNHIPSLVTSQAQRATHSLSSEVEVFLPKGSNQSTPTSIYGCYATSNLGVIYSTQQEKDATGDYFVTIEGTSSEMQFGGKFVLNLRLGSASYQIESPILEDLQEDCKWNLSVVVRSTAAGYESDLNASLDEAPIVVDFIGYNAESNFIRSSFAASREFYPTAHGENNEMYSDAILLLKSNLRFFMGATYSDSGYPTFDTSGTLTHECVANAGTLRVWCAPLSKEEIKQHALKPLNYGVDNPSFNIMSVEFSHSTEDDKVEICKSEALMLDWRFDNIQSTDENGNIWVDDYSPGRPSVNNPLSTLDKINTFFAGQGVGFAPSSPSIIDNRFIFAGQLCLPESVSSDNTIRIMTTDESAFTKNSRPKRMFLSVEKSMYQNISQEMMNVVHSITEFSSLIGAPVNKYRSEYKDLRKLRELFFKNVENTPELEKYMQFYKWIDGSLSEMLMQLMPATVNQLSNTGVRDIVEPHVFERNKYQHKFPELISLGEPPETVIRGHAELNYNWRLGHAPIELQTGGDHDKNHLWWSERVERDSIPGSANGTSVEDIDIVREELREALIYQTTNDLPDKVKLRNNINLDQTSKDIPKLVTVSGTKYEASPYFSRRLNKHSRLLVDPYRVISGGSNFLGNKKKQVYKAVTSNINSDHKLVFDFDYLIDSPEQDEQNIYGKRLLHTKAHDAVFDFDTLDGDSARLAPFSIYERKSALYDGTRLVRYDDVSYSSRLGYASSLDSLRQEKNLEITNLHGDSYLDSGEVPMQGPFTQQHIGGNQHRHVPVFTPRLAQSPIAEFAYVQRPEAFDLDIDSKKIELSPIGLNSFEISSPAVLTMDIALANNATTGQYTQLTLDGQTQGGETIFRPIFGSQHGANTDYIDVFIGHRFVEDSYTLKHLVADKYNLRLTSDINNPAAVPAEALASLEQIASNFVSIPDQTLQIIQNRSTEELFPHRIVRGLATLMREEHAKRPLNIKNIKSSDLAPGNFKNQYEIMSAGPRGLNNRDFIKNTQNYSDLENLSLFNKLLRENPYRYDVLDPVPRLTDPSPERYRTLENAPMSHYPAQDNFLMGYWFDRALADLSGYGLLTGSDIEDGSVFVSGIPATGTHVQFPYTWFDSELMLYENTNAPGTYLPASQLFITECPLVPIQNISGVSDSSLQEQLDHYSVVLAGLPRNEASGDFIYNDPVVTGIRPRRQLYALLFSNGNPWSLAIADSSTFQDSFWDGTNQDPVANILNVDSTDREAYNIVTSTGADSYNQKVEPVDHRHRTDRDREVGGTFAPQAGAVYFSGRPNSQENSTLTQLPFTPVAGATWRAASAAASWDFIPANSNNRFEGPLGADAGNAGDAKYDVMGLGADSSDISHASNTIKDWPGATTSGGNIAYGAIAVYNQVISPKSSPSETRITVSFEIAGAQVAANTGVARNDYGLDNPPEAQPFAGQPGDDVWIQFSDADDLQNWTTLKQIQASQLGNYSDWTSVVCDYIDIEHDHPGLKFRIVNQTTGNPGTDQWIIRNFQIKQFGWRRLLNNSSNPDVLNGRPAESNPPPTAISGRSTTALVGFRWTKQSVIRGVDDDGDSDDGTIASPDPSNGEAWSLDASFEIAAYGTDGNGSSAGIAKDNFGIHSGPTEYEDFYLLYNRSDSPGWTVWKKLLGSDAEDGNYLDWTSQEVPSLDNLPANATVEFQIMSYIDMEGFDRFANPHPTGATWIMRNLQFERGTVVAEDVSPRWYSAMRLNLPFTRKTGLNDSVDISFDIQYLEANAGGPGNDYQEDLYLVVAEKGANWDTQGTNPEITVISYHEIDLSGITAYSPGPNNTTAERIAMVTQMRSDRASAPVDLVSVTNIPIPENKEVLFYLISERTHLIPEYVFVFSDIAIHHSGEVRLQGYTPKDIADYTQMRTRAPFEKQNINRMPSGDHIIVERFSSPGDIYTMGQGSLDRLSGQYSPYNALSFRNRKLSNILNIESSKVYNGPYDSSIPEHKVHRNVERKIINKNVASPLESSGWVFSAGADIIDV